MFVVAVAEARWLVPKMVKNGLNSPSVIWGHVWASFLPSAFVGCPSLSNCEVLDRRSDVRFCDDYTDLMPSPWLSSLHAAKTCLPSTPVSGANRQNKNKNHFRPISEHACVLHTKRQEDAVTLKLMVIGQFLFFPFPFRVSFLFLL